MHKLLRSCDGTKLHKIRRLEFSGVVVFVKKLQKFVTAVSQCYNLHISSPVTSLLSPQETILLLRNLHLPLHTAFFQHYELTTFMTRAQNRSMSFITSSTPRMLSLQVMISYEWSISKLLQLIVNQLALLMKSCSLKNSLTI
jgi:hypothetical protein